MIFSLGFGIRQRGGRGLAERPHRGSAAECVSRERPSVVLPPSEPLRQAPYCVLPVVTERQCWSQLDCGLQSQAACLCLSRLHKLQKAFQDFCVLAFLLLGRMRRVFSTSGLLRDFMVTAHEALARQRERPEGCVYAGFHEAWTLRLVALHWGGKPGMIPSQGGLGRALGTVGLCAPECCPVVGT